MLADRHRGPVEMTDLKNRVALVTGASRGIGAGIAIALARAGANVAVNYREKARRKGRLFHTEPSSPKPFEPVRPQVPIFIHDEDVHIVRVARDCSNGRTRCEPLPMQCRPAAPRVPIPPIQAHIAVLIHCNYIHEIGCAGHRRDVTVLRKCT